MKVEVGMKITAFHRVFFQKLDTPYVLPDHKQSMQRLMQVEQAPNTKVGRIRLLSQEVVTRVPILIMLDRDATDRDCNRLSRRLQPLKHKTQP